MKNVGWSDDKKKMKGTLHGFNNYKVMVNLDLATLVAIFSSRIVKLFGH